MSNSDHRLVARVVEAITHRTDLQEAVLAAALAARWSSTDRHEPAGLEMLRRQALEPIRFRVPACSCAAGRCLICN
jgi:hypothetical protein